MFKICPTQIKLNYYNLLLATENKNHKTHLKQTKHFVSYQKQIVAFLV